MIMLASEGSKIRTKMVRRMSQRRVYTFVTTLRQRHKRHIIRKQNWTTNSSVWSTLLWGGGGIDTWLGAGAVNQYD